MNIQPTIKLHPEYHFAPGSDIEYRCLGLCWSSKPKEYTVSHDYKLEPIKKADYRSRIKANQRLATILSHDMGHDQEAMNELFERLKDKLNYDILNGSTLTSEKIAKIINILYEVKIEYDTSLRSKKARLPHLQPIKSPRNPRDKARLPKIT